jgi:UDP-glucose 4-epimerase
MGSDDSSPVTTGFHIGSHGVSALPLPLREPLPASSRRTVLVTGGAGYIGSHTCVELLEAGFAVVVVDNLVNAKPESLLRVHKITGHDLFFYSADLRDETAMDQIFTAHSPIDSVIHFAGLKAVGESVALPLLYYENNIASTVTLLKVMQQHRVNKLVFSSSATVYGDPKSVPITEDSELHATNPYGRTKLFIEEIIKDYAIPNPNSKSVVLRYFNPVGAHPSGTIGEDPNGIPNNLVPYISQVAVGKLEKLRVFGTDWPTPDGTGVRDYIHVVDLAKGHIAAIQKLIDDETKQSADDAAQEKGQVHVYNLGTGKGYSVLDMVRAMSTASGKEIELDFVDRRPGDIATCYADPVKAKKELGWSAHFNLTKMMEDAWRWQSSNPQGYPSTNDHLFKA